MVISMNLQLTNQAFNIIAHCGIGKNEREVDVGEIRLFWLYEAKQRPASKKAFRIRLILVRHPRPQFRQDCTLAASPLKERTGRRGFDGRHVLICYGSENV